MFMKTKQVLHLGRLAVLLFACWESERFWAVCVAWSWFRQSGVLMSHPPTGNYRILHKSEPLGIVEQCFIG
jgi:hypothetical protein